MKNNFDRLRTHIYSEDLCHLLIKVVITHLAILVHLQTTDHAKAMQNVPEQCISLNSLNANVFKLKLILLNVVTIAIAHNVLGPRQQW